MTIADFQRHLTSQGCKYMPLSGTNVTGSALKVENPQSNKSVIVTIYKGGQLNDETIRTFCDRLFIKYPPGL